MTKMPLRFYDNKWNCIWSNVQFVYLISFLIFIPLEPSLKPSQSMIPLFNQLSLSASIAASSTVQQFENF